MIKIVVLLISLFLIAEIQGLVANRKAKEPKETQDMRVTNEQLLSMLKEKSVRLVDVRSPWEIENEGKISGSVNIPLNELETALSMPEEQFHGKFKMQKPKKDDCNLVFHCKGGGRSLKAVTLAREMGWHCSRHLVGGFEGWKKLGAKN
eukprot:gene11839-13069_t